tara:strand:- start:5870 stop:6139 length:270 start_codon:yes stop_codon:yes gene_type:complete
LIPVACRIDKEGGKMDENLQKKLEFLEYKIPMEDQFLFERIRRGVDNSNDVDTIKSMAIYFAKVATERNAIIKGLISELISPDNIVLKS